MKVSVEGNERFNESAPVMPDLVSPHPAQTRPSVVPEVLMPLVTCFEAGTELSASAGRWEGLQGCLCWKGSIWRRSQLFVTREAPPHPTCHGQARQTDRLLPNWHLPL